MSRTVSTIDYKALAGRIKTHADDLDAIRAALADRADITDDPAADLRTVVSLLEGMADAKPVAWVEVADSHEGPYTFHGQELLPAGKHSLFAHPAPQPQPTAIPAPFMHLLGHAYGLSLGTDWNRGTHAKHYRRPLLDAVSECKRWLDSAPQPQPEREPLSDWIVPHSRRRSSRNDRSAICALARADQAGNCGAHPRTREAA